MEKVAEVHGKCSRSQAPLRRPGRMDEQCWVNRSVMNGQAFSALRVFWLEMIWAKTKRQFCGSFRNFLAKEIQSLTDVSPGPPHVWWMNCILIGSLIGSLSLIGGAHCAHWWLSLRSLDVKSVHHKQSSKYTLNVYTAFVLWSKVLSSRLNFLVH